MANSVTSPLTVRHSRLWGVEVGDVDPVRGLHPEAGLLLRGQPVGESDDLAEAERLIFRCNGPSDQIKSLTALAGLILFIVISNTLLYRVHQ